MSDLNHPWRIGNSAGGVAEEGLLLLRTHEAEELTGLCEVIIVVLTEVPVLGIAIELERRFGEVQLLLPLAVAVGLVADR
ncbi:MAG: hypothetical protein A4E70_00432 [Syntrophus sp. PtaU1.Bin005]|nr:MAG: hypothetical protein A4E70_00432 [Syntrophus sp. PtaU1.Bin005]